MRHRATVDFSLLTLPPLPEEAPLGGGLSSPRGTEEVGGRQGAPALPLCHRWHQVLSYDETTQVKLFIEPENKLKNDLLN